MINNELFIKKCTEKDVDAILELQEYVIEHLEDKNVLRRNTKEMFIHCTKEPNLSLGVYHNNTLIALSIFVDEKGTKEDLSININKKPNDVCANFKLVIVRNDYRGMHLQKNLMWILERYAFEKGYTKLCTTVSPDNKYSLNNIINSKYEFDSEVIKYGGLNRYLYVKDIKSFGIIKNKKLLDKLKKYEKDNKIIQLNLEDYYNGQIDILHSGDVVEYINENNEKMYGIYYNEKDPLICLFNNKTQKVKIINFNNEINNFKINKCYISIYDEWFFYMNINIVFFFFFFFFFIFFIFK